MVRKLSIDEWEKSQGIEREAPKPADRRRGGERGGSDSVKTEAGKSPWDEPEKLDPEVRKTLVRKFLRWALIGGVLGGAFADFIDARPFSGFFLGIFLGILYVVFKHQKLLSDD